MAPVRPVVSLFALPPQPIKTTVTATVSVSDINILADDFMAVSLHWYPWQVARALYGQPVSPSNRVTRQGDWRK